MCRYFLKKDTTSIRLISVADASFDTTAESFLEDVQRTDGEWPFPLGRMLDEPLDIVVEITYRVHERQDDPFVHPAATPQEATGTFPTTGSSAHRPREDADDRDALPSPREEPNESRRKRQGTRRAAGYDLFDDVPHQVKKYMQRRILLDDVPLSVKRARQTLNMTEAYAFAADHSEAAAKNGRSGLKLNEIIRDAGDHAAMMRHSLQQALEKEWATWCK